jgi:small-conductance mechanosensitive channel
VESFDIVILSNPISRWILSLVVAAAVMAGVSLWRWLIGRRLRDIIRTNTFLDEVGLALVENTAGPIVLLLALYTGSLFLIFDQTFKALLRSGAIILLLIQIGIWGNALISRWVTRYDERNLERNAAGVGTVHILSILTRFTLYSLVVLLILDNLPGVEITTLLAGLGIGGVAVALAVQNILSDVFASLSIALDKPFILGDLIAVGEQSGTVEHIGLKTTRVRSISGEQLVFSNNDLLGSRLRNFARMEQRRVVFGFRVGYETPPELLRAIPGYVQTFVEAQADARFDRASLLRFDDLGLFYEVVYFVTVPDFGRYIAIQEALNLALIEQFAAMGIGFAFLADAAVADRRSRSPDTNAA